MDYNRYTYVRNNPLNYTDPTGLFWDEDGDGYDDYSWETEDEYWERLEEEQEAYEKEMQKQEAIDRQKDNADFEQPWQLEAKGGDLSALNQILNDFFGDEVLDELKSHIDDPVDGFFLTKSSEILNDDGTTTVSSETYGININDDGTITLFKTNFVGGSDESLNINGSSEFVGSFGETTDNGSDEPLVHGDFLTEVMAIDSEGNILGYFAMEGQGFLENSSVEPSIASDPKSSFGWLDGVQLALDGGGLVPGFGIIPDAINTVISIGRGNWVEAGLNALAMIPIAGQFATGGKLAGKGLKYGDAAYGAGRSSDEFVSWLNKGPKNSHVYYGTRNGENVYVGITKNISSRQAQHGSRFILEPITDAPLTRNQARSIEQYLITSFPNFENAINSISPTRTIYNEAIIFGEEFLR